MSHLKLSFGGERILTAAPLTQLSERRSTCTAVEYVCVCVLRGGGVRRGSRLYWLWFKAKWWSRHWTVTLNHWSWLIHPSLTTGRHLKGRALLFEKRSVEPGGVVNLSWGKGDCCGPVATDFTLLRLTCQIGEFSKSKSNLPLLPAYKLDSFRF